MNKNGSGGEGGWAVAGWMIKQQRMHDGSSDCIQLEFEEMNLKNLCCFKLIYRSCTAWAYFTLLKRFHGLKTSLSGTSTHHKISTPNPNKHQKNNLNTTYHSSSSTIFYPLLHHQQAL